MRAVSRNFATALVTSAALLAPSLAHAALAISNKPTQNVSCTYAQCSATAPKAVLNAGDLAALLAQYSSVYINDYAALGIVVAAPVSWTSTSELYLDATGPVTIEKPVAVTGKGALTIFARALNFSRKGSIDFWNLSSGLTVNNQNYKLVGDIATLASAIKTNPSGNYALAKDYDATMDGPYTGPAIGADFHGVLEGLGHVVSNFSMQFTDSATTGAFLNNVYGTVRDFGLTNVHASVVGANRHVAGFGALAISNNGLMHNTFASGRLDLTQALDGRDEPFMGGLVAANGGMIEDSHTNIDLKIAGEQFQLIGGLAGFNTGTISKSYSQGKLESPVPSLMGGLAASNYGIVKNSYSTTVMDNPAGEGGLILMNQGRAISSYASGKIKQVAQGTGGIVASEKTAERGLSDCYWNLDDGVSDPSDAVGNIPNYPGGTGLTGAQLQSGLPEGFDPKIWAENPAVNNGLPYLISNPPGK